MNDGGIIVRLISKIGKQSVISGAQSAKCFYLTVDSELHIAPKLRPKAPKPNTGIQEDEDIKKEEEPVEKKILTKPISFRLQNTNDRSLMNKLVISRSLYHDIFNEDEVFMVKFDSRAKFCDLDFPDFLLYKQSKNPSYQQKASTTHDFYL